MIVQETLRCKKIVSDLLILLESKTYWPGE